MTTNAIENGLIKNIARGDPGAFEEIYNIYNKKVFTFSYRYLKNKEDAEGIVQEVFLSLWQSAAKLREDSNVQAYIFTLTFNAIRKRFRKLSREVKHIRNYAATGFEESVEISEIEYNDLLNRAKKLIDKLPPQQKKIMLLRQDTGLSNSEIADLFQISKKTVENHLHSAKSFLRKAMKENGMLSIFILWMLINS